MLVQIIGWICVGFVLIFISVNAGDTFMGISNEKQKIEMFKLIGLFLLVAAICFK